MTSDRLFRGLAEEWPTEPDADLELEIREMPTSLLNWLLVCVFNGSTPPIKTKEWIKESLDEAKTARKGDLVFWRLIRWTSLAAAREILGQSGKKPAEAAVDWIVPASKKAKTARDRTELCTCVIGLLSYLEADDALSGWRGKQLEQEWDEFVQASIFQTLYLTDPASSLDDLDQLSFETANVCAKLIEHLPGKYASGLVLALARRARDNGVRLGAAMTSGLHAFQNISSISVEGPRYSLGDDENGGGLAMILTVKGEGRVEPMSYLFPQIVGFTRVLRSFLLDVTNGEAGAEFPRKPVLAAVRHKNATITIVVKYDPRKLEVPKATQEGLARRLEVAVAHARTWESKLCAKVKLQFQSIAE